MRTINRVPILAGLPVLLACPILFSTLFAQGASAALKKYRLDNIRISESTATSPVLIINRLTNAGKPWAAPGSRAVIDDSGAAPVLKKLLYIRQGTNTTLVPTFGGFIFLTENTAEGPTGEFTGAGSTDTTIAWGLVTGWTVTGTWWCKSSPALICQISQRPPLESVDPFFHSSFFDLGTWTFHGTGWTARPFVEFTYTTDPLDGNMQSRYIGALLYDGTVPAVPALGLALLGGSLVLGSLAALRKGKK